MSMSSSNFRRWRKRLKLSQKDAAKVLGLKPRIIQYYEKGERDGKTVDVPRSVRLACYAIEQGVADYDGDQVSMAKGSDAAGAQKKSS